MTNSANTPVVELRPERTDGARLVLAGRWTLAEAGGLAPRVDRLRGSAAALDAAGIEALDTSGALLLLRAMRACGLDETAWQGSGLDAGKLALLKLVDGKPLPALPRETPRRGVTDVVARIGETLEHLGRQSRELIGFVGLVLATLGQVLIGRRKLRLTATVFHMEQTGLDAVPIVALLSFLIGAVVAFLGATVLADFGAAIFTVELVTLSFLREFGVLLTAILLAGRSGSAFTAQIGSMKSREEIDAIRALGLDAVELLVIPRLVALVAMLPILFFVSVLAGILGGGLVGMNALDISPAMWIARMQETTELHHFWVGLAKAPVFAFLIAVVGCLEGLKVEGSAESVGRHTTSSVVQAIFLVILFDAMFAIFFMELDI
jgi:phospholipid/cholesterol/gamma-HCH transport system permease protein